jgi:hypothetical protein
MDDLDAFYADSHVAQELRDMHLLLHGVQCTHTRCTPLLALPSTVIAFQHNPFLIDLVQ